MAESPATVRVWDPLVRLFHWSLVGAYAISYFTQEQEYELHVAAGYTVTGLVVFRVVWGVVGPRRSRFSGFVRGPAQVYGYLRGLTRGKSARYLGYNPAGGAMIVAQLILLAVICASGVALDAAENRSGPLADTRLFVYTDVIVDVHELATNVSLALIALHLIGVAASSWAHRENLVLSMITGRKRAE